MCIALPKHTPELLATTAFLCMPTGDCYKWTSYCQGACCYEISFSDRQYWPPRSIPNVLFWAWESLCLSMWGADAYVNKALFFTLTLVSMQEKLSFFGLFGTSSLIFLNISYFQGYSLSTSLFTSRIVMKFVWGCSVWFSCPTSISYCPF